MEKSMKDSFLKSFLVLFASLVLVIGCSSGNDDDDDDDTATATETSTNTGEFSATDDRTDEDLAEEASSALTEAGWTAEEITAVDATNAANVGTAINGTMSTLQANLPTSRTARTLAETTTYSNTFDCATSGTVTMDGQYEVASASRSYNVDYDFNECNNGIALIYGNIKVTGAVSSSTSGTSYELDYNGGVAVEYNGVKYNPIYRFSFDSETAIEGQSTTITFNYRYQLDDYVCSASGSYSQSETTNLDYSCSEGTLTE